MTGGVGPDQGIRPRERTTSHASGCIFAGVLQNPATPYRGTSAPCTQPAGGLVARCKTLDQARAVVTFLDAASEKTLRSTVALTASRGRGKVCSACGREPTLNCFPGSPALPRLSLPPSPPPSGSPLPVLSAWATATSSSRHPLRRTSPRSSSLCSRWENKGGGELPVCAQVGSGWEGGGEGRGDAACLSGTPRIGRCLLVHWPVWMCVVALAGDDPHSQSNSLYPTE